MYIGVIMKLYNVFWLNESKNNQEIIRINETAMPAAAECKIRLFLTEWAVMYPEKTKAIALNIRKCNSLLKRPSSLTINVLYKYHKNNHAAINAATPYIIAFHCNSFMALF